MHFVSCILYFLGMVILKVLLVLLVCSPVEGVAEDDYDGMSSYIDYVLCTHCSYLNYNIAIFFRHQT